MLAIAKINRDTRDIDYLYENRHGRYVFSKSTNMHFNTEDEVMNFIQYNRNHIDIDESCEELFVMPVPDEDEIYKAVRVAFE